MEMACIITDENLNIVAEVVMDSSLGQQMTTYMYPTQIIITNMLIAGTADSITIMLLTVVLLIVTT